MTEYPWADLERKFEEKKDTESEDLNDTLEVSKDSLDVSQCTQSTLDESNRSCDADSSINSVIDQSCASQNSSFSTQSNNVTSNSNLSEPLLSSQQSDDLEIWTCLQSQIGINLLINGKLTIWLKLSYEKEFSFLRKLKLLNNTLTSCIKHFLSSLLTKHIYIVVMQNAIFISSS